MATLTSARLAIPYPDGTERVMDGDNAMGAIAAHLDDLAKAGVPFRFAAGVAPVSIPTAAVSGNATVTLPAGRFTVAPIVVVTFAFASTAYYAIVTGTTTSQFTATIVHRDGVSQTAGAQNVNWVAVQMLAGTAPG